MSTLEDETSKSRRDFTDFLTKYLQEDQQQASNGVSNGQSDKRSFARLMSSYKNAGGVTGLGSMDAYSLLTSGGNGATDDLMTDVGSLNDSGRAFSYASVPVVMRNRLKEVNQSHRMRLKDIRGEVFDWIFTHLEAK